MNLIIRIAQQNELPQVAKLISLATSKPVTVKDLLDALTHKTEGTVWYWWVALQNDEMIGVAQAVHFGSQVAGRFELLIAVAPSWRRKGVGRKILDDVRDSLKGEGATRFVCKLREDFADGIGFAQSQGFDIFNHSIASSLSIPGFNPTPFRNALKAKNLDGIQITNFSSVENSEHNQRLLCEINRIAYMDDPGELDAQGMPFESWRKVILEASWFDPAGQIIAIAENKFVGLSSVFYEPETKTAETGITGVDRAYRGRGVALALKLEAIRYVQELGAERLVTENDSNNGAMLAINKKLGFVPQKGDGIYTLVQDLI